MDETALSFAEIKALCAGDPRIKEKMDLDVDVSRLKLLKADHQNKQYRMEDDLLRHFPQQISQHEGYIRGIEEDMATAAAHPLPAEGFVGITVRGDVLTDKENVAAALSDAFAEAKGIDPVEIGTYRGFSLSATYDVWNKEYKLHLGGRMMPKIDLGERPRAIISKIEQQIIRMPERISDLNASLANIHEQIKATKAEVGKPFPQEEELQTKTARLIELTAELDMDQSANARGQENMIAKNARPSVLDRLKAQTAQAPNQPKKSKTKEMER